mmetsp:Transcript_14487/g.31460  ORF Transcript_14487/g.31460 Transcript_14487/m.31460 type:complete len:229 (-) Transcript_14487:184-870(-)
MVLDSLVRKFINCRGVPWAVQDWQENFESHTRGKQTKKFQAALAMARQYDQLPPHSAVAPVVVQKRAPPSSTRSALKRAAPEIDDEKQPKATERTPRSVRFEDEEPPSQPSARQRALRVRELAFEDYNCNPSASGILGAVIHGRVKPRLEALGVDFPPEWFHGTAETEFNNPVWQYAPLATDSHAFAAPHANSFHRRPRSRLPPPQLTILSLPYYHNSRIRHHPVTTK